MGSELREKVLTKIWGVMARALQNYKPQATIKFDKEVRFHPKLSFGQRIFLAEVQAIHEKGKCHYSCHSFGKIMKVSHQTIINWVRQMVDMGLLEVGLDNTGRGFKKYLKPLKISSMEQHAKSE